MRGPSTLLYGSGAIGGPAIDEDVAHAADPGLDIVNNPNGLIDNSKARSRGVSINSLEKITASRRMAAAGCR